MKRTNLELRDAEATSYQMEDGSSVHFVVAGTGYFDVLIAPPELEDVPVDKLLEHCRVDNVASEKLESITFPGGSGALACSEVNGVEWITIRTKYTMEEQGNYGRVFQRLARAKAALYSSEAEAEEEDVAEAEDDTCHATDISSRSCTVPR